MLLMNFSNPILNLIVKTHILYKSKWEFNFEDKIEKTGKLYMEERITQNFFES
jgi:hypothetical protein